jgi:hypothetical protein
VIFDAYRDFSHDGNVFRPWTEDFKVLKRILARGLRQIARLLDNSNQENN